EPGGTPGYDEAARFDFNTTDNRTAVLQFYEDWLDRNGWQSWGSDDGDYARRKDKVVSAITGLQFTGFDGAYFGAPWFQLSTERFSTYRLFVVTSDETDETNARRLITDGSVTLAHSRIYVPEITV